MIGKPIKVRVVVADEHEAGFFDFKNAQGPPESRGALVSEAATLHDKDLETDRPGRGYNHFGSERHAVDGERSTVRHATELFAREVARAVDDARVRHEFDRLVIIAGPRMLGLIREALPPPCRSIVAAEIAKDLVHQSPDAWRDAVPHAAFLH
jgi:protein required for attachment to host cells